jgi:hypothetical protein
MATSSGTYQLPPEQQLLEEWSRRIDDLRADATAGLVLPDPVEHPVVSSDPIADGVAVSERAARGSPRLVG